MNWKPTRRGRAGREEQVLVRRCRAFTLVEMLVSVSVLLLITMMMAQLITNTTNATVAAGKNFDSDTQARCVFDRFEADLDNAIKRDDVDFYFDKQAGNDQIYFYSQVDGYYPPGDMALSTGLNDRNTSSLVGYRVNTAEYGMERLSRGLHWNDSSPTPGSYTSMVFLPTRISDCFSASISDTSNTSTNVTGSQWDVVGDQIFRLELSFLLTSGTVSQYPNLSGSSATAWNRSDVVAIVATVATLDKNSRKIMPNLGAFSSLSSILSDAVDSPPGSSTTAEKWVSAINQAVSSPPPGIPKSVISSVRVYQRYFYLNGQNSSGN